LVAAHLKSVREALDGLKRSMTVGAPPMILTYEEVCEGVGFNKYWVCIRKCPNGYFARNAINANAIYRTERRSIDLTRYMWTEKLVGNIIDTCSS
jgi:hypothetical protein